MSTPASRQRLNTIMRPLADALQPPDQLRQTRALDLALQSDGKIAPAAIIESLPWITVYWYLTGGTALGTNQSAEIRIPQNVRVKRIDALLKTAPGSQNLLVEVTANNVRVGDLVNVPKGAPTGVSVMDVPIAAGSILRLNTIQTGGSNLTVCVSYALDSN